MSNDKRKIGFIGVGNMASAMITGMLKSGICTPSDLCLYDISPEKSDAFASVGANKVYSIKSLCEECNCVVLSVKPQNFSDVLGEIAKYKDKKRRVLYISIGAGIKTETVSGCLSGAPVVRALPNTPMLIGKGLSAVCRNAAVTDEEYSFACSIFASAGEIIRIDESEMNRIISVTSSSPAYVFMFIKAICEGAKAQGLDGDALKSSVCAMVRGSADLLEQSELTPDELVRMVCSKGGTTERAVNELNKYGFSEGIASAMLKCTERADELGEKK